MRISLNWINDYFRIEESPEEVAERLTQSGLEVEGLERVQSIKGGLKGVVVGKVKSVRPHSNADRLQVASVDVGNAENLQIVCGAPNLEKDQKVVVATVGSTLYPAGSDEGFPIKKAKIRGEESFGMICSESELGLGESHEGIMVLDQDASVGTAASEFFEVEEDVILEIGLTPNRTDGMSHFGTARDLAATHYREKAERAKLPDVPDPLPSGEQHKISIQVEDSVACPRYAGLVIADIEVGNSPGWLQNRLMAIGLTPINNVVDITNYVLHETGQPLHAFDLRRVGNTVKVRKCKAGTRFTTLDEVERELHQDDLMICNDTDPMCIAGVFGGIDSGVTDHTTSIFLESACFDPTSVRKTASRHGLSTDASFRFERGVDPNGVIYALKRAASLIKELTGGRYASELVDVYEKKIDPKPVSFSFTRMEKLIGASIDKDEVKQILQALDIEVAAEEGDSWQLNIPTYRVDVTRFADVVEEVLRIYGYNRIPDPDRMSFLPDLQDSRSLDKMRSEVGRMLSARGFSEIFTNSLVSSERSGNYNGADSVKNQVRLENPLSRELDAMRQSLLPSALDVVRYNINRQHSNLKLFEFGTTYRLEGEKYDEESRLALVLAGNRNTDNWKFREEPLDFFDLKRELVDLFLRLGLDDDLELKPVEDNLFSGEFVINIAGQRVGHFGEIQKEKLKIFDLELPVYAAELNFDRLAGLASKKRIEYAPVSRFPSVVRDLSLTLDRSVKFDEIKEQARKTEKKLLKEVELFDVYEGKNLPEGKKSYALRFVLRDDTKTLKDKQIDGVMKKIIQALEQNIGAELRN